MEGRHNIKVYNYLDRVYVLTQFKVTFAQNINNYQYIFSKIMFFDF